MFDASGALCWTYLAWDGTKNPPPLECVVWRAPVYLIIGERSRVLGGTTPPNKQNATHPPDDLTNFYNLGPDSQLTKKNLFNNNSLCVSIVPQTGYSSVHEIAAGIWQNESAMGGR